MLKAINLQKDFKNNKNTFKIFSDVNEEEMISESDSTENKKNLLFEIGFDTVTNKYRVFNRND